MDRTRALALCTLAGAFSLYASGCTTGGESMFIVQNQAPGAGCVIPKDVNADFIARGRIDTQATAGYLFTPVIQSEVTESANGQASRVLTIQGANVDLTFQSGFDASGFDGSLVSFSEAFSGSIFPGGSASFAFDIISKPLLDQIAGHLGDQESVAVDAKVVAFGDLQGDTVKSSAFHYTVDVCKGCMLIDNGACASLPAGFTPSLGGECNTLQDVPLDCCTDDTGALVCPATPPGG